MQREVYSGVDRTHGLGGLGKSSCKDENPEHEHDVLVGSPL